MLPLCTEYPARRKQMITIDIDTSSGVPFTGELNKARPKMSAQTRNPSKKMMTAAPASRSRTVRALRFSNMRRDLTEPAAGIESRRSIQ
jgi:hypothetical protein